VLQGVVGVLEGQLALAHTAHAGEVDTASFWGQQLSQALEFRCTAHVTFWPGGSVWEVVGGVVLWEFRFG
jgi:hypothetical protein